MKVTKTTATLCALLVSCSVAIASDLEWPREYTNEQGKLVLYQPQVTSWDDFTKLEARMALAFAPPGSNSPTLGTVQIAARTDTNLDEHRVRIYDITITASAFPTLDDARAERFQQLVLAVLPEETEVELERLATNLERFESEERQVELKVEPEVSGQANPCASKPKHLTLIVGDLGSRMTLRQFKLKSLGMQRIGEGCVIEAPPVKLSGHQ